MGNVRGAGSGSDTVTTYTVTVDTTSTSGGAVSVTSADGTSGAGTLDQFSVTNIDSSSHTVQASITLPAGEELTPQMKASLVALAKSAGAVNGEVGGFGDSDFPVNHKGGNGPNLSFSLTGADQQNLSGVISDTTTAARTGVTNTSAFSFKNFVSEMIGRGEQITGGDVESLVEYVLRESYMQTTEDLRYYAEKVKYFNAEKKAIREHVAELRKISSNLSGVADDDRGTTDLNGDKTTSSTDSTSGGTGTSGVSGSVVYETAAERKADNPTADSNVAEFTGYSDQNVGSGTALESYLIKDTTAQDRLIEAIPYMTVAELSTMLGALGGSDMRLDSKLSDLFTKIVGAMSDGQKLGLAAVNGTNGVEPGGDFATVFQPMLNKAMSAMADTDGPYTADDYKAAMEAWNEKVNAKSTTATDGITIDDYNTQNPSGSISGTDAEKLIAALQTNTSDPISADKVAELLTFYQDNRDRMTPSAQAAFDNLQGTSNTTKDADISATDFTAMLTTINGFIGDYKTADADFVTQYNTAHPETTTDTTDTTDTSSDTTSLEYDSSQFDLDPSDGAIDSVTISDSPPFVRAVEGKQLKTCADLDTELKNLDDKLNSVGDDAQLANTDLQNVLQKQQQTLTMMSNILKMFFDTAMNVIRKIGA